MENTMKPAVFALLPCALLLTVSGLSSAQEVDAFLACAQISDREQRLICLDAALDDATAGQAAGQEVPAAAAEQAPASVETFGETPGQVAETTEAGEGADRESIFRLPRFSIFRRGDNVESSGEDAADSGSDDADSDRLESFGRQARVVINENGEDELHDTITELFMARPNQWLVRLASGQVWRQVHPKRLNLREGDAVRIYPTGWGDNFRLETPRLDGYIQVLRVED